MKDQSPKPKHVLNRIPDEVRRKVVKLALKGTELSPRELAVTSADKESYFVSEASVYRVLKAHDLITSPAFIMINCSHPVDFGPALASEPWANRIRGLRANASTLDHGTLCQLGHLEEDNPDELASQYVDIRAAHPKMNVFGGYCGTDYLHVKKIGRVLLPPA